MDSFRLRSGQLTDADWEAIAHAAAHLSELELLIGEGTPREAELLYEKLQSKDCGLVFGKN